MTRRLGSRIFVIPDTQVRPGDPACADARCTKCGELKPSGAFNMRLGRGKPYRQCRECMKSRRWAARNPERSRESQRQWVCENRGLAREIWREMAARKRKANPSIRIHGRISNQIWYAIRGRKAGRKTFDLLGYSFAELKAHIERQFVAGMGWNNMGEWHIDHITPLSSFDISGPDDPELRRAWSLANLRPLWAADNLRKGDKMVSLL